MFTISGYLEAETLMRALLRFKFECPQEAKMFAGSPIMSQTLIRLLEAMKSAHDGEGEAKAKAWRGVLQGRAEHGVDVLDGRRDRKRRQHRPRAQQRGSAGNERY
jgi:hypothetical protein